MPIENSKQYIPPATATIYTECSLKIQISSSINLTTDYVYSLSYLMFSSIVHNQQVKNHLIVCFLHFTDSVKTINRIKKSPDCV